MRTVKDNHALRVAFIRSVINLPSGDENDALAFNTLLAFIRGTAVCPLAHSDDHALSAWLAEIVRLRGQAGTDTEALTAATAGLARQMAEGEMPLRTGSHTAR